MKEGGSKGEREGGREGREGGRGEEKDGVKKIRPLFSVKEAASSER